MKTLSLKLDDNVFEDTEKVVSELNLARNRYIDEALNLYNQFNLTSEQIFSSKKI